MLYNMNSSPNINRMIMSKRMRWAGNVARMERRGIYIGLWWEGQKERDHDEDSDMGGWIVLRRILGTQDLVVLSGFIWFRAGTGVGLL
jgi:hypothetical protein